MQPQYSQGAAPSHHPPPYTPPKLLQPNGGSTTSSLRQWRKKDFVEKQVSADTNQSSTNDNPSHIARVAPHTYYPRPAEDPCNYQQQYGDYSATPTYKPPVPVKYSEIVESQQPQTIEHITPVIQKQKEKEYVDLCNGPIQPHLKQYPDHLPMKQSAYPDSLPLSHQYIPKDSQMYPFLQKQPQNHQYIQKEPYQQFLSKYNMQSQFSPQSPYSSQPNDFLAHLNKINPRMAQSIINDTHLRDTQLPTYHNLDQNRPYPQPQRMYTAPCASNPQRNLGPTYNYPQYNYNLKPNMSPGDPYNRVHQYHHNASKYVPEQHMSSPQRYYNDHYAPFPPNYQQLEYAQHYQHRRQFPQEYYLHPSYKGAYPQNPLPEDVVGSRKSSLKQFLESWVEEDLTVNASDIIAPNSDTGEPSKGTITAKGGDAQDEPLYVLDTTDIPNDNLPHFLHLQQVEKLPDNIKGYYQTDDGDSCSIDKETETSPAGAIIPEVFDRECSIVATVENDEAAGGKEPAADSLENKVVQIHIVEAPDNSNVLDEEPVSKNATIAASPSLSDSQSSFKSMPEINGGDFNEDELPDVVEEDLNPSVITDLEEGSNNELVISNNCDTGNIPIDLGDITNDTNTSKDCETLQKTDLTKHISDVELLEPTLSEDDERKEVVSEEAGQDGDQQQVVENLETLDSLLDEITIQTKEHEEVDAAETSVEQTTAPNEDEVRLTPPPTPIRNVNKKKSKLRARSKRRKIKKTADVLVEQQEQTDERLPALDFSSCEQEPSFLHEDDVDMPVLEREAPDENETNVVYHINDSNVVLQIGDELLEINVTMQNDKKIIMVKTFSDAMIMNNTDENPCPVLEEQAADEAPAATIVEDLTNIETVEELCDLPIANDVYVCNEEIVSSSTEIEPTLTEIEDVQVPVEEATIDDAPNKCLEPKPVRKHFKTKAALKLLEPQDVTKVPCKPKPKRANDKLSKLKKRHGAVGDKCVKTRLKKTKHKEKIEPPGKKADAVLAKKKPVKNARVKRREEKKEKVQKNDVAKDIDMLYKMSIVPTKPKCKEEKVEEKPEQDDKKVQLVSVQEHSITSSTCQDTEAADPRKRASKIIQQINDDWEDDLDVKQEDNSKRRLSLQEYNDRKRIQEQGSKMVDYDKLDLTSNLLQNVGKRRELSPVSSPRLNVNFINRTYSRNVPEKEGDVVEKRDEPLSSRIELQLPNQRRLLPKPNYNQEYLRNALMNDLHTVNQITATLMKENQQLMQRFLEQQRLTTSELKKVKQIIRYKRLVHHLTNMKLKETQETHEETTTFEQRIGGTPPKEESAKCVPNASEKRKKKRFRFLYSGSESEVHEPSQLSDDNKVCCLKRARTDESVPAVDYSVHQSNSQSQLTLVFKRSFKTDPKMQPFVKLERIRSLDWLASKLQ